MEMLAARFYAGLGESDRYGNTSREMRRPSKFIRISNLADNSCKLNGTYLPNRYIARPINYNARLAGALVIHDSLRYP